ncbi:uncharacterized protein LOC117649739 [Thrips palmi]|uniref:Uncharacterized protein LOC117649739 n=1 Tax=Thrips palmi TaxID=161013 RepID=A0A6P8ZU83_THRPL|nr:uncharacterized protein LOC117649739 [Thrips palmi]
MDVCCKCGEEAGGGHRCSVCKKPVHAIEPCSVGAPHSEEGYGQPRICGCCSGGNKRTSDASLSSSQFSCLPCLLGKAPIEKLECSVCGKQLHDTVECCRIEDGERFCRDCSKGTTPSKVSRKGRSLIKKKLFSPQ